MVLLEPLNMVSTKTLTITLSHNAPHTNNLRITRIQTRSLNNISSHMRSPSICHRLNLLNNSHNSRAAAGSAAETPLVVILKSLSLTEMLGVQLGPIGLTIRISEMAYP